MTIMCNYIFHPIAQAKDCADHGDTKRAVQRFDCAHCCFVTAVVLLCVFLPLAVFGLTMGLVFGLADISHSSNGSAGNAGGCTGRACG